MCVEVNKLQVVSWMGGWVYGEMYAWLEERTDGWVFVWVDGWKNGSMVRSKKRCIGVCLNELID